MTTPLSAAAESRLRSLPLSYEAVGATAGSLPPGYHPVHRSRRFPLGGFHAATEALMTWRVHEGAGLSITASGPVALDALVRLGIGAGRLRVSAPCRVVYVVDEPDRVGFAYGTLHGHPVSGEEAFVVSRDRDGCAFTITAFSRPATLLAKASGPVGRGVQHLVTGRYLAAVHPR